MIISVTERGVFRRCKQQWDYSSFNRQHLTPLVPPTALSFGGLMHKALEYWLINPESSPNEVLQEAATDSLIKLKASYKEAVGVEPSEVELKGFMEQVMLAQEMLNNYQERWGGPLPEGFTLVQPEQTLILPIPNTEHHLEATLDALMKDAAGRLWILERKTYGQKPKIDILQMNDQFVTYTWAVTQIAQGEDIGGLFYDGMWKRNRFDDRGKERALDDLFFRTPLIFSPEEISNLEKQLQDEVHDMADPDLRVYRNRAWTGCWDCSFDRLCTAEWRDEDSSYIKQRFYTQRTRNDWQTIDN